MPARRPADVRRIPSGHGMIPAGSGKKEARLSPAAWKSGHKTNKRRCNGPNLTWKSGFAGILVDNNLCFRYNA